MRVQSYNDASDMWTNLRKLYLQTKKAREFYLDLELAKYVQGDKKVQDYYNGGQRRNQ